MKSSHRVREGLSLAILFILIAPVLIPYQVIAAPRVPEHARGSVAQQGDPEEESATLDSLLPAESYALYGEVRNVGQQIMSGGFRSVFETLLPLMGEVPKELSRTIMFASAHAKELSQSRMVLATMPTRRDIPPAFIAIELSSSEVAREFEPDFKEFLTSLLMPVPSPAPAGSGKGSDAADAQQSGPAPFFIKRMGRVVAFSNMPFTLKQLRPEGQKLLSDDQYFRDARAHFASEDLFVYYDSAQYARASKRAYEEVTKAEATEVTPDLGRPRIPAQASPGTPLITGEFVVEEEAPAPPTPEEEKPEKKEESEKKDGAEKKQEPAKAAATPAAAPATKGEPHATAPADHKKIEEEAALIVRQSLPPDLPTPPPPPADSGPSNGMQIFDMMMNTIFSGMSSQQVESYESIGLGLAFEGDTFAVRALFLSSPGAQVAAIPFLPFLVSGPPISLAAANYMPSDAEIFVSGSLDIPRIFGEFYPALGNVSPSQGGPKTASGARGRRRQPEVSNTFEARVAAFEKKRRVKIREELLPAVGNEVALALPARAFSGQGAPAAPEQATAQIGPMLVISIQNKPLLRPHIPAVLELFDIIKPGEKVAIEKRGEIEINRYASASFALVDDFLIAAQDVRDVRRALDARSRGETLGASKEFRDYARWQPRHLLNQLHVSSSIMKGVLDDARKAAAKGDDRTKDFFAQLNFAPEPISYAASMEVLGAQHEIRLPKNLIVTLIASMLVSANQSIVPRNEMNAKSMLSMVNAFQEMHYMEHGRYATPEELKKVGPDIEASSESSGYRFELVVGGGKYHATATPIEYGKTGRLSFYTDETGVVREGDHGGGRASAQDKAVEGFPNNSNRR